MAPSAGSATFNWACGFECLLRMRHERNTTGSNRNSNRNGYRNSCRNGCTSLQNMRSKQHLNSEIMRNSHNQMRNSSETPVDPQNTHHSAWPLISILVLQAASDRYIFSGGDISDKLRLNDFPFDSIRFHSIPFPMFHFTFLSIFQASIATATNCQHPKRAEGTRRTLRGPRPTIAH